MVALFKFWVVGSVASVGKNCHKCQASATQALLPWIAGPLDGHSASPGLENERMAGKDDEGVVMCAESE